MHEIMFESKMISLFIHASKCAPMDMGVYLNLASFGEISNIHTAFENKENANGGGKG